MGSRIKEDERNERAIRRLLKLPANRRCINCNSMGPQYVCTNFSTFICISCSGIHREFTHRVKSISMAKFTSQEVSALQEGGNERAKEIYFKHWDYQHHSVPESSDVDRLRDFIKQVYVNRRYTGERIVDGPPQVKGDDGTYDHNYSEQRSVGNPAYDLTGRKDQDDRSANGTDEKKEDHRFRDELPKPGGSGRSENHHKGVSPSGSSTVEPSRDIRGGLLPVRLPEPPRSNRAMAHDISAKTQSMASPGSKDPGYGNQADIKSVTSRSLIDFDSDPEPPQAGGVQTETQKGSPFPANDGGWATFDVATPEKASLVLSSSSASTLENQLLQLSSSKSAPPGGFSAMPNARFESFSAANNGDRRHQLHLFPASNSQSSNPPSHRPGSAAVSNQLWGASLAPIQGTSNVSTGVTSCLPSVEALSGGRKALSVDLFTMGHPPVSTSVRGLQTSRHLMMGYGPYGMQYPGGLATTTPAFSHPGTMNPFDTVNGPRLAHASTFPSLTSLQGTLPEMSNPTALSRASSMGPLGSQWLPPQQLSHSAGANSSPYMVQQHTSNMPRQAPNNVFPVGHQAVGGFGARSRTYGISGMEQRIGTQNPQSVNQNSVSRVGGNPFM